MNWNPGDIAIYVGPDLDRIIGQTVEIISITDSRLEPWDNCAIHTSEKSPHSSGLWGCRFSELEPLPPLNEVTTWDECVFKPRELVMTQKCS